MTSLTDYSNTVIYKISCRDPTVSGVYVGHTVDFIKRKYAHQKSSEDNKCTNLLYRTIRMHGGWNNWEMKMVGFFHCNNLTEAREKEQEFFISLNASLNSVEPMPNRVAREKVVAKEVEPVVVEENVNEPVILTDGGFRCEACDYTCHLKQHYKQHCITKKHSIKLMQHDNIDHQCPKCNKHYKNRSGLWKHAKVCNQQPMECMSVMKQLAASNNELRDLVIYQAAENRTNYLAQTEIILEQKRLMEELRITASTASI